MYQDEYNRPCNFARFYDEVLGALPDGAHVVEVGAFLGVSAAHAISFIKRNGRRIRFDVVDTFEGTPELAEWAARTDGCYLPEFAKNMRDKGVLRECGVIKLPSVTAAAMYADGSLDLVFIDACHDADNLEADCNAWWPKIRPGGLLAGHDWHLPSVREGARRAIGEIDGDTYANCICWVKKK